MRYLVALLVLVPTGCATPRAEPNLLGARPQTTPPAVTTSAPSPSPTQTAGPSLPAPPEQARTARVVRVVDGDTVVLTGIAVGAIDRSTGGRKARLIGVDTPEVYGGVECLGREASAYTKRVLNASTVLVDFDVGITDRYGRALVYVWLKDGSFFNAQIVADGFATPLTVPPNVRYAPLFVRVATEARRAGRGLWSSC